MNKSRLLVSEVARQTAFFMSFYAFFVMLTVFFGGEAWVFYTYLLAAPFFLLMFLRHSIYSLPLFALSHIILPAASYFIPLPFYLKLLCVIYIAVMSVYSFIIRLSAEKNNFSLAFMVLAAAIHVAAVGIASYFTLPISNTIFICNFFVMILCYLMYQHIQSMEQSLEAVALTTIQPVKSVVRFNNAGLFILFVLVAVAAVSSMYMPIGAAIIGMGRFLLNVVRFVVSLFNHGPEPEPIEEIINQPQTGGAQDDMFMPEPGEPFILWVILEKIFMFLGYTAIIGGIIAGLIYILYRLHKRFYAGSAENSDIKEYIGPEMLRSPEGLGRFFPRFRLLGYNGPEQRIRRMFYKKVEKHIKKGLDVQNSSTARDISNKINETENIGELTVQYEQARYGQT